MVPGDAVAQVQAALIAAATQGIAPDTINQVIPGLRARIGQVLYATTYVQVVTALGSWARVSSLGIGSANTPGAVVTGSIAGTVLTVTGVTSGTLTVGQA